MPRLNVPNGVETTRETAMTSLPIRDPVADHLITPENSALILIDYQRTQFSSVRSIDPVLLLRNIVTTVKTAKLLGLPIVHSTVNVNSGQNKPTVPELAELLKDNRPVARTASDRRGWRAQSR
jgi:nicotinamidase-related amidase